MRNIHTETIFVKANRLAREWMAARRRKKRIEIQQEIVSQLNNWATLIEFVDCLKDKHELSNSESGFNHELDDLAVMLNDQYGAQDFKRAERKKFFFGCSAGDLTNVNRVI